jgi:hypothetical protein
MVHILRSSFSFAKALSPAQGKDCGSRTPARITFVLAAGLVFFAMTCRSVLIGSGLEPSHPSMDSMGPQILDR